MTPRTRHAETPPAPLQTTLLDLVVRLGETTESEEETVLAALALLDSGRVQLTGNFRGQRITLDPHPAS